MHREPDVGFDPGSPGSRPGPKAGAKPLRHPGIPKREVSIANVFSGPPPCAPFSCSLHLPNGKTCPEMRTTWPAAADGTRKGRSSPLSHARDPRTPPAGSSPGAGQGHRGVGDGAGPSVSRPAGWGSPSACVWRSRGPAGQTKHAKERREIPGGFQAPGEDLM